MEILIAVLMAAAAVGAVLVPFIAQGRAAPAGAPALDEDAIEAAVARYREALRAGTVCARCVFANPPGSRFCADCGRPLFEPGAGDAGGAAAASAGT
ncbi:MAG TPA: hypothetical protein VF192_03710 [Longimicrobiales bacterium]